MGMMIPTMNTPFQSLDPSFKPVVQRILDLLVAQGYSPVVVEGRRTIEQQAEKVKLGYSKTMQSYHLTGLAADICDRHEMWDRGIVRKYWWDMYIIAKSIKLDTGRIRCGIVWDHPEREAIYKQALDDLLAKKITQQEADKRITWFADVAHLEVRV